MALLRGAACTAREGQMSIYHIPAGKCPEHGATTEAVFRCVVAFKRDHGGDSPTAREIAALLDIPSTSTVAYHLGKLERAGRIVREPGVARRIAVTGAKWVMGETA